MDASLLNECSRVFEHADPYTVSGYISRRVGTHCIRLPVAGRPQASFDHRAFASLGLCRISYGATVRIASSALESIFHPQILLRGHCLWRGGGQEHALAPGELLLINPDDPVDLTYSADCEKFIVKLPCAPLEAIYAEQRRGHPARGMRFLEYRYRLDQLEGFVGLLTLVCREVESGERLARVGSRLGQILGSKLLTLLKTNVSRGDPGDAQVVFARLDTYIRRHLQSEIEVAALAEQVRMSTRSPYALFERQLGESPRQYIRRLHLERVRACLEDPGCRVRNLTELALGFGFAHLGHPAEQYRWQFGKLSSETLCRRAWRRPPRRAGIGQRSTGNGCPQQHALPNLTGPE